MKYELTVKERSALRRMAGLGPYDRRPVVVVEGDQPPRLVGEGYYWTTRCRRPGSCDYEHRVVQHPGSYGWGVDYHPSTRRVEVGAGFVQALRGERPWAPAMVLAIRDDEYRDRAAEAVGRDAITGVLTVVEHDGAGTLYRGPAGSAVRVLVDGGTWYWVPPRAASIEEARRYKRGA